jgi:hypothetical protein
MVRFPAISRLRDCRIHGSHHVMRRGTIQTVVPAYGPQTLRIGTLRGILRDIDMSPVEFSERWTA